MLMELPMRVELTLPTAPPIAGSSPIAPESVPASAGALPPEPPGPPSVEAPPVPPEPLVAPPAPEPEPPAPLVTVEPPDPAVLAPPAPVASPVVVAEPALPLVPEPVDVPPVAEPVLVDVAALEVAPGPVPEVVPLESEPQPTSHAPRARPAHVVHRVILRELRCSSRFRRFKFFTPKQA
jgi:hypothetical protein